MIDLLKRSLRAAAAALAAALMLQACGERPSSPRAAAPSLEQPPVEPPVAAPVILGVFPASDAATEEATGALTVQEGALVGALAPPLSTETLQALPASAPRAQDERSLALLLDVAPETPLKLRRITGETLGARTAGYCRGAPATFAVLALDGQAPERRLRMAIFSGADAPGPTARDSAVCGVFTYREASGG
jgi:hypothetical protein